MFGRKGRKGRKRRRVMMKRLMIAAGLCMALSGCIGFRWTSKVDDGAVYELNREMYIAEEDGLILVDTRTYYTIKGTLPAGTKLQEAEKITRRGFSFWWLFGPYSNVAVYGEVLGGDFNGRLVDFGEHRQRCPKHGVISSALRLRNMIKRIF